MDTLSRLEPVTSILLTKNPCFLLKPWKCTHFRHFAPLPVTSLTMATTSPVNNPRMPPDTTRQMFVYCGSCPENFPNRWRNITPSPSILIGRKNESWASQRWLTFRVIVGRLILCPIWGKTLTLKEKWIMKRWENLTVRLTALCFCFVLYEIRN